MRQCLRSLLVLALPLSILAACGTDRETGSPVDTTIDLTGVMNDCPGGDILGDIAEIFPTQRAIRHVATVNCGQVFRAFEKGDQSEAIDTAFAFFQKTLQQNEDGKLLDPDPSVETKIVDLFSAIFAGIGFPLPEIDPQVLMDGEYAIGTLIPDGPPVITLSRHAGIGDPGNGLFGPVDVFIVKIGPGEGGGGLELSSAEHPCPAGVDDSFDCYPLFFDYSVFPESNVNPAVGLQLGQCNVSPDEVEVLLLSPEGLLPEDDAPINEADCADVTAEPEVSMSGWRSLAWTVLEPVSPLFRVTPAFAGKSPIGGRISNFSPVAPVDPSSGGEETLGSIEGFVSDNSTEGSIEGATVDLFTAGESFVGTTTTNSDGFYSFSELDLGSYFVEFSAEGYESASSEVVELTEESPDADVNIGLDPALAETATELTPEEANMDIGFGEGDTQLFTAAVTAEGGVNEGTVTFTVTGVEFLETFDEDVVEGTAFMDVGCGEDSSYGDLRVPEGEFTVDADYSGTENYAASSDPEASTLTCGIDAG